MATSIVLEKTSIRGAPLQYTLTANGATLTSVWGQKGGALQTQRDTYSAGKQGRSAAQQAVFEAVSTAKRKVRLGYRLVSSSGLAPAALAELSGSAADSADAPAPMLASSIEDVPAKAWRGATDVFVQPKLDGRRCLANLNTGQLFSRGRKPMTGMPHISAAVRALRPHIPAAVTWLDGELYRHGYTFQAITSAAARGMKSAPAPSAGSGASARGADSKRPRAAAAPDDEGVDDGVRSAGLQYHVYDALEAGVPFSLRWSHIQPIATHPNPAIVLVETHQVSAPSGKTGCTAPTEFLDKLHASFLGQGYEGSMVRLSSKGYEEGKRSKALLKRKDFHDDEFEVVGYRREAHEDTLGSVILTMKDGKQFSARPAMSDADRLEIWRQKETHTGSFATVRFFELTDDGIPRFPVLVGFRASDDL